MEGALRPAPLPRVVGRDRDRRGRRGAPTRLPRRLSRLPDGPALRHDQDGRRAVVSCLVSDLRFDWRLSTGGERDADRRRRRDPRRTRRPGWTPSATASRSRCAGSPRSPNAARAGASSSRGALGRRARWRMPGPGRTRHPPRSAASGSPRAPSGRRPSRLRGAAPREDPGQPQTSPEQGPPSCFAGQLTRTATSPWRARSAPGRPTVGNSPAGAELTTSHPLIAVSRPPIGTETSRSASAW